jgi:ATP-binding cassette subfamily F protein uup
VDFHDVSLTVGGRTLVEGFELALTKNERVGIVGPNGAGKTTLLRAVVGEVTPSAGEIVLGKNTRVAYLAQSRASLEEDATIRENVAGKRKEVEYGGRVMDIRTYLDLFLFDRRRVEQPVRALSGGERARVALARLLLAPANLLLLDEPTNDLDVHTLGSLEEMIASFDGAVLVVTHDRHFLDRVATSILAFEGEGQVVRYAGDYSTYRVLEERQLADAPEASAQAGPASASDARDGASKPKRASKDGLTYAERKELDGLMETIEAAEAEIARLEGELSDPAVYADRAEDVKGLVATLEAERERVETLLSRWEELESKKEAARS